MERVTFYSYKPYLFIGFKDSGVFITFSADCTYSTTNEEEIQILREYSSQHLSTISESIAPAELRQRYEEWEEKTARAAEEKEAAKLAEEKERKEWHDIYSALRFSEQVSR